jgi:hypothetical protein
VYKSLYWECGIWPHGIPTINLAINKSTGGLFHPIAIKQADSFFVGAQGAGFPARY